MIGRFTGALLLIAAHRECMRHEMCAHAKDPVKCEARAKAHAERRNAAKKPSG